MVFAVKILVSAALLVLAAEVAKRSPLLGAVLISLPLTSMLSLSVLYHDTGSGEQVARMAKGIILMIIPSLVFFIALAALLRWGQRYWWALLTSSAIMAVTYFAYARVLEKFGIKI